MKTEPFEVSTTHRPHLVALDSLRGIAALFIVIMHFDATPIIRGVFERAFLMVDLFFVLSGFAIYYAYHDRLHTASQVKRFVWLRFWRLYPIHFVMITYFVGVELAKPVVGLFAPIHHAAFSLGGWKDILANLLLLQSFNLTASVSLNPPSWSISTEFYVYVLYASLSLSLCRKAGMFWASLVICLSAMTALALFDPLMDWTFDYGWVRGLAGFFAGVFTAAAYLKLNRRPGPSFDLGFAALSVLAALGAFIVFKPTGHYENMAIVPFSSVLILLISLSRQTGAIRVLCSRPIHWLGVISYSIYMVHAAVGFALGYMVKTLMPTEPSPFVQMILAVINIAIVIAVASSTFLSLEMPIRVWSRKS